jgi:hypothetical protein
MLQPVLEKGIMEGRGIAMTIFEGEGNVLVVADGIVFLVPAATPW